MHTVPGLPIMGSGGVIALVEKLVVKDILYLSMDSTPAVIEFLVIYPETRLAPP